MSGRRNDGLMFLSMFCAGAGMCASMSRGEWVGVVVNYCWFGLVLMAWSRS